MAQMTETVVDIDRCRRQIRKVLDSPDFTARKQLSEFLHYVCEAAFQSRTHLDQVEIAEHVLHRSHDFNPLDDASVRKLATLTRHRLEAYYAGTGKDDPIVVALPVRSYVPKFHIREEERAPARDEAVTEPEVRTARRSIRPFGWLILALAVVAVSTLAVRAVLTPAMPHVAPLPVFRLETVRGDFMHAVLDLPGQGIRVGPKLADTVDMTVRMVFTPEHALQQAGMLVYNDPDRYVKFWEGSFCRARNWSLVRQRPNIRAAEHLHV